MRLHPFRIPGLLFLLTLAAGCGDDNPAGPGSDPMPAGLRLTTFQAAELVIGQSDMVATTSNAGGSTTNAVGLRGPVGAGGGALYVPDLRNHRVLGFAGVPSGDGPAADFVLGQPDLSTSAPGRTSSGLNEPSHCTVADGKLFVADARNARVLIWNSLPTGNVPADVVVGQVDFVSTALTPTASILSSAQRVAVGGGKLVVTDGASNRVLIWNTVPTTNGAPADVVLGQSDFTSTTLHGLTASSLRDPEAVWTDGTRLVVAGSEDYRVLIWNSFPTTNNAPADVVLGAPDFTTPSSGVPSATSIGFPGGVTSDGASLFVADCSFNRVLIYTPFPTSNGAAATAVLGQSSFTTSAYNDSNQDGIGESPATARTLSDPADVSVVGDHLLVADQDNNRVLAFRGR